jgi:Rod binding domain-containing protein
VAQDFEAQALGAMLQPIFATLPTGGFFGGGAAEAQWRPMLVDAIARDLARSGGLGLAASVQREITRMQAEATP